MSGKRYSPFDPIEKNDWDESKHSRDEGGKFASTGGGIGAGGLSSTAEDRARDITRNFVSPGREGSGVKLIHAIYDHELKSPGTPLSKDDAQFQSHVSKFVDQVNSFVRSSGLPSEKKDDISSKLGKFTALVRQGGGSHTVDAKKAALAATKVMRAVSRHTFRVSDANYQRSGPKYSKFHDWQ